MDNIADTPGQLSYQDLPVGQTLASLEVDEPIGAGHVAVQCLVLAIGNVPEVLPFYRLGASFHLAQTDNTFALTCGQ